MIDLKIRNLHWELSVLSQAVAYSNLTSASENIGISQSQLSRIIGRIEHELNIVLLDRSAPRKSSWMPIANHLAKSYVVSSRRLESEIQAVIEQTEVKEVRLGTLEGFIGLTIPIIKNLLSLEGIERVHVEVEDISQLEAMFSRGELDLLVSVREPGRKKYKWIEFMGYQPVLFEEKKSMLDMNLQVFSSYEYMTFNPTRLTEKTLISNSLQFKKTWLDQYGGKSWVPGQISKKSIEAKKNEIQVARVEMLGRDDLAERIWKAAIR